MKSPVDIEITEDPFELDDPALPFAYAIILKMRRHTRVWHSWLPGLDFHTRNGGTRHSAENFPLVMPFERTFDDVNPAKMKSDTYVDPTWKSVKDEGPSPAPVVRHLI